MRIEQLEYFLNVSETKSLNISAERLFVTQPTISEAIHKLEEEFDSELLIRSRKGVELTATGEIVCKWAKTILENVAEMKREVYCSHENHNPDIIGDLCIGVTNFSSNVLLPTILSGFSEHYPNINITTYNIRHYEMTEFLEKKAIDLGIFNLFEQSYTQLQNDDRKYLFEHKGLLLDKIYEEPIQVIANKSFLISKEKMVSLKDVVQYPLIMYQSYTQTEKEITHFLKQFGDVNIVLQTDNPKLLSNALLTSKGIGLFTKTAFGTIVFSNVEENSFLRIIKLQEKLNMNYYLCCLEDKKWSIVEKVFIEYLKSCLAN